MSKDKQTSDNIRRALALDGSVKSLQEYYADWSDSYDSDLRDDHVAPRYLVEFVSGWLTKNGSGQDFGKMRLMDIGCGTGLVGSFAKAAGFEHIDGVDLSVPMIDKARQLSVYSELTGDVDVNHSPAQRWQHQYDVALCCGVFTLGHVAPSALMHMAEFVKPGGTLCVTTRLAYYQQTNFQGVSDLAQNSGLLSLRELYENAPYTNDSSAHYWLYQVN